MMLDPLLSVPPVADGHASPFFPDVTAQPEHKGTGRPPTIPAIPSSALDAGPGAERRAGGTDFGHVLWPQRVHAPAAVMARGGGRP